MVSIELRTQSVESNSVEWETIVLLLADGGHIEVEGDAASLDLSVPVISVTSGSRLYCEDDPEEWARSLPTVYHAPDFMGVVVDDTDPLPRASASVSTCLSPRRRTVPARSDAAP